MDKKILILDCETYDPCLKTYGMGWCLAYHYPEIEFQVVGFGYASIKTNNYCTVRSYGYLTFPDNYSELLALIKDHDTLVFHNALYDMGALRFLYREDLGSFENYTIIDTMLLAKLHNQSLPSYSLDYLSVYHKVAKKKGDILNDYAWSSGMYQAHVLQKTKRNCHTRPSDEILHNFCMSDIRKFPLEIQTDYCLGDIVSTEGLLDKLLPILDVDGQLETYSDILKVCLDAKTHGIRVDLTKAKKLSAEWLEIAEEAKSSLLSYFTFAGFPDINIDSGKQLAEALVSEGYKLPKTVLGNDSITAPWLEANAGTDEILSELLTYRQAKKAEKDFIQKLLKYQKIIPDKYKKDGIGWMYTTLKPLGATATGRFTSGGGGSKCLELNILAVSKRNEKFGAPIRTLFLPHKNEKLICRDFSNQEPRLQVHYAHLLKCGGANEIVREWNDNPSMKYHQKVADITQLPYDTAKTVTLGLAYDMHAHGLSKQLKISLDQAEALMEQYHRLLPFMRQLHNITSKNLLKLGYIKTIGGRKLYIDPPYTWNGKKRTQERKAMSKLIQGSGADQTIRSMILAWKAGLKVLLSVHDEILVTSSNPEHDFRVLGDCMENSIKLSVPVITEGNIADNWGDAK